MAADERNGGNLLLVAFIVCLVCGVVVSATAVTLRPMQQENRLQFRQINILHAAGVSRPGMDLDEMLTRLERRFVELETGEMLEMPPDYDPLRAARDPAQSVALDEDPALIRRVPKVAEVWLIRDGKGDLQGVVLPIHGFGAWATMYGFLALETDFNTVTGISFYDHGETPGLGGEIGSVHWQQNWEGKKLFDEAGIVAIQVIRGSVELGDPESVHRVDGISGATVTTRGVNNLVRFWIGENGYGPYLRRMQEESRTPARH